MKCLPSALFVCAFLGLVGTLSLDAQVRDEEQVVYWRVLSKQFDPSDMGMSASDRVHSFAQDEDGIIYCCAAGGTFAYDGARWRRSIDDVHGIRGLVFSDEHALIGVQDHLFEGVKRGYEWQILDPEFPLLSQENERFGKIYSFSGDRVLIVSNHTSFFIKNGEVKPLGNLPGNDGWTHEVRGQVYSMDNKGDLYRFDLEHEQWVHDRHFALLEGVATVALLEDDSVEEGLLLVSYKQGLFRAHGKRIEQVSCEAYGDHIQANVYQAIRVMSGDYLLATLGQGVFRINARGDILRVYTRRNTGLQSDTVNSLFEDREGGVWLATDKGVTYLPRVHPFEILDGKSGYEGAVFSGELDGKEGLLGTSIGLNKLELVDGEVRVSRKETNAGEVDSMVSVAGGHLATTFQWVYWVDEQFSMTPVLSGKDVLLSSPFVRDRIWARFDGILFRLFWDGEALIEEASFATPFSRMSAMAEWRDGVLLIVGSDGRLYEWVEEDGNNHLKQIEGLPFSKVSNLSANEKRIWAATEKGLYVMDARGKAGFVRHPLSEKLQLKEGESIHRIFETEDGRLIVLLSDPSGNRCQVFNLDTCEVDESYSWIKSLRGFSAGSFNYQLPDGLSLMGFLGVVRELKVPIQSEVPKYASLLCHAFWYEGKEEGKLEKAAMLPYERHSVSFDFSWPHFAYDYRGDSLVNYRYRLVGEKETWSAWSKTAQARFDRLPEGNYRFEVEAKELGSDEVISASFEFGIRPPWVRTWWAYLLYLLFTTLVVVILVRWRIAVYEEKTWVERYEREKVMRLENSRKDAQMQALKLQLNPHFLVNAINSMRAQQSLEKVKTMAGQVAEFLNGVLYDQKNDRVPVFKEMETAKRFLNIAKLQMGSRLEYEVTEKLFRDSMQVPTMIIQPLIENAVKYGTPGKDGIRRIHVTVEEQEHQLEIRVENTGKWIQRDENYQGIGVKNIRERLELLHEGKFSFDIGSEGDWVLAVIRIFF